jgi:ribonuclease P protein component
VGLSASQPVDAAPTVLPSIPARIGITVSRRVGGAVVRNRVKRLLKEAFRRHKRELPADLELVVIARPCAAKVQLAQAERELLDVARRLPSGRHRPYPSRHSPSAQ